MQPASERGMTNDRPSPPSEVRKDELGDILREHCVAPALAESGGIHEINGATDQFRKRLVIVRERITTEQFGIIPHVVPLITSACAETAHNFFCAPVGCASFVAK